MSKIRTFRQIFPRVLVLAFLGAVMLWMITAHWGLGLSADPVLYWQAARNLAVGQGLVVFGHGGELAPLTAHLPLYPFILSWSWLLGVDALVWARMLSAGFFAANILLIALLAWLMFEELRAAMIAAAFFLISVQILTVHLSVSPAPMLLTLMLGTLIAFLRFDRSGERVWFYVAAVLAGLSALTHFSGWALILALETVLFFDRRKTVMERFVDAKLFAAVAFIGPLLWLVRGWVVGAGVSVYALDAAWLRGLVDQFSLWALPSRVAEMVRWVILGLLIGGGVALYRKRQTEDSNAQGDLIGGRLLRLYVGIFLGACLVLRMFLLPDFAVDQKALVPVYAVLALLAGYVFSGRAPKSYGRFLRGLVIIIAALMLIRSTQLGLRVARQGIGYGAKVYTDSKVLKELKSLDDSVTIYSNDPNFIYYLLHRPSVKLAGKGEAQDYLPAVGGVAQAFASRQAIAVVFVRKGFEPGPWWQNVLSQVSLEKVLGDDIATVYMVKKDKTPTQQ